MIVLQKGDGVVTNEDLFTKGDFSTLYEKNKRYIYSLVKKYPNLNAEDVISCGNLGFTKAVKTYSLDKDTKFITYASMCINNEILMFIRKDKKHNSNISLNSTLTSDAKGNEMHLEDIVADDFNFEDDLSDKSELNHMRKAILMLPDNLKQLITLKLKNKTQQEIAQIMNLSQSYISRIEKKAYKELKVLMEGKISSSKTKYEINAELILKAQEGSEKALNEVVSLNLPLVSTIAKKFLSRGYEYEDIFQIGSMGLIKAIKNFTDKYNTKFSTYAVPMIIGEIKRFIRDDGPIKVSRNVKSTAKKLHFDKEALIKKLNREPTIEELSEYSGISEEDVKFAVESTNNIQYLYDVIHHDDGAPVLLIDKLSEDYDKNYDMIDKLALKEALRNLDRKSKQVIILRYYKDKTQKQAAEILGLSQVQISRIEKNAQKKLKEMIGEDSEMSKKDEAFKLFEEEKDNHYIQKELGITLRTVETYKTDYNRKKGTQRIMKGRKNEAFELFKQGMEAKQVSEKLGLALTSAQAYKSEYNTNNKVKEEKTVLNIERKKDVKTEEETILAKEEVKAIEEIIYSKEEVVEEKSKLLKKTVLFEGSLMDYKVTESGIQILPKESLNKGNFDIFVKEILELKEVV
ncbi:RNA polymerase sigma-F factor [Clostridium magnum DSM 2767]|nr:RNA polymerase sigma-F factor [Clostridium magnum DSM 2767]